MSLNILIVEDDERIASFLERGLRSEGYRVHRARTGTEGLHLANDHMRQASADGLMRVLILDVMLPGMSGLELCQTLRAGRFAFPILMLSALSAVEDRVSGLRMGADDYLAKPFAFEELLARIEALARRGSAGAPAAAVHKLQVADLELDLQTMRASRAGHVLNLTARELAVLELLMRNPGRLFSRERILSNVWGSHEDPLTNIVDVYIRRLRSKMDEGFSPQLMHTVRRLGYRLEVLATPE